MKINLISYLNTKNSDNRLSTHTTAHFRMLERKLLAMITRRHTMFRDLVVLGCQDIWIFQLIWWRDDSNGASVHNSLSDIILWRSKTRASLVLSSLRHSNSNPYFAGASHSIPPGHTIAQLLTGCCRKGKPSYFHHKDNHDRFNELATNSWKNFSPIFPFYDNL